MDVLETLGCAVQLLSHFSEGSGGGSGATYQVQSVGLILLNVVHDAPVLHPLCYSDELPLLHVFPNPNKFQDVRMG